MPANYFSSLCNLVTIKKIVIFFKEYASSSGCTVSNCMMVRNVMKGHDSGQSGHSIKLYYGICLLTLRRTTKNELCYSRNQLCCPPI